MSAFAALSFANVGNHLSSSFTHNSAGKARWHPAVDTFSNQQHDHDWCHFISAALHDTAAGHQVTDTSQQPAVIKSTSHDVISFTAGTTFIIYQLYQDADLITEKLTEAFLDQLQQRLADQTSSDGGGDSETAFFSSLVPPGTNMTQVLITLKGVARDILNYCRHYRSEAILPLLREFSQRGSLAIADVDPDLLRNEIQHLLNLTTMSHWYATSTKSDTSAYKTEPWTAALSSSSNGGSNGGVSMVALQ